MTDHRLVLTERLELSAIDPDRDVAGLFPIFSDPKSWWHNPVRRHEDRETTYAWLVRAAEAWHEDGLSYWAVRERGSSEVLGVGGAQRHVTGSWNLLWRIAGVHQRRGFATELGGAALRCANAVDNDVPAIAWILAHNEQSIRVAQRIGLRNCGPRHDSSDGRERLAYADREL